MFACKTVSEKEEPTKPPNILWITCEDMSPRLGSYGDPIAKTPNIDNLAREGIRFNRAHPVSGVSAPSRAALITGMYLTSFGDPLLVILKVITHEGVRLS